MGLPLMLITVFGNRLLPKSGPWMETVKIAFGFVILALPVFLLERVIGDIWGLRLWGLAIAFFSWRLLPACIQQIMDANSTNHSAGRSACLYVQCRTGHLVAPLPPTSPI